MDPAVALRRARARASMSQRELARRAGTSQATISAYESGAKEPSVRTLDRLLRALGARLTVAPAGRGAREPTDRELKRAGRGLAEVIALAEALPVRHERELAIPPAARMTLAERVLELHRGLKRRRVPHAFGGAIALAYATLDPRGTRDIDLNLFVSAADAERALAALPKEVNVPGGTAAAVARDGQVRVWWDDAPLDLFFAYEPIHDQAARNRRTIPFEGTKIPVLGPVELAVFKAMVDRTRDWADIEAMTAAGTLDLDAVRDSLATMLDAGDARFERLAESARRGSG